MNLSSSRQSSGDRQRKARARDHAPPLSAWLFAVLFGLIFVVLFNIVAASVSVPRSEAFLNHNRSRLDRFAQIAKEYPAKMRVVILGNSSIKYGTAVDEETFRIAATDDVHVLRIVNNWASFSDFAPFAEQILALNPDVIVFQADLLGRVRLKEFPPKEIKFQRYLIWQVAGQGDWNPDMSDQAELQEDCTDFNDKSDARFARRKSAVSEWQRVDLTDPGAQQAKQFIETALTRNIKVALLYMPVTEKAQPLQDQVVEKLSPAVNDLLKRDGVSLLQYPHPTDESHYSDFVHMNKIGREVFTSWLVPELKRIGASRQIR